MPDGPPAIPALSPCTAMSKSASGGTSLLDSVRWTDIGILSLAGGRHLYSSDLAVDSRSIPYLVW